MGNNTGDLKLATNNLVASKTLPMERLRSRTLVFCVLEYEEQKEYIHVRLCM